MHTREFKPHTYSVWVILEEMNSHLSYAKIIIIFSLFWQLDNLLLHPFNSLIFHLKNILEIQSVKAPQL